MANGEGITKKSWKSDSTDGGLLFLLFHKRIEDPNKFSAPEIYDHPLLPFKDNYSKKSFASACQTAANRCLKWESRQQLSKVTKEHVANARVQYKELLERLQNPHDYSDDEEDEYLPSDEEDVPLIYDDESISGLSAQLRNAQFSPTQIETYKQKRALEAQGKLKRPTISKNEKAKKASNTEEPPKAILIKKNCMFSNFLHD